MQEALIEPLPDSNRHNPKSSLLKAELIKFVVEDLSETPGLVGCPPFTIQKLATFGLSAVDNSSSAVRRMGEKIMVKLYEIDPATVRRVMPPYDHSKQKRKISQNYKYLFEAIERRDKGSATASRS